jgi:hypothetical protein
LVVVLAGFALRLLGLQYGLPYVYNPDEVAIMTRALSFATGTLNPHNFLYPTFFFYVLFAWVGSYLGLVWLTGGVSSLSELPGLYFSHPGGIYTAGRLLVALLGTATILAVYRLAGRLGDSRMALAAAVFVAVAPLHVRDSHYVKHDVPATLAVVIAYLAMTRAFADPQDPRTARRRLVIAAAACGLAFSIHYYCVFLAIPLLATALISARSERVQQAVLNCIIVTAISVGIFILLSPFVALEPLTAWRDITANREIVVDRAVASGAFAAAARYADMLLNDAVGMPVAILAVSGIVAMLRSQLALGLLLLSFPVAFFLFISNTFPASRYLNPLVPFAVLFASAGVRAITDAIFSRKAVVFWILTAAAAAPALYESVRTDVFFRRTDTRTIALQKIASIVPDGATIATQPYSAPLEPTRESVVRALERKLGQGASLPPKFALQLRRDPWPRPSYDVVYLGRGLDADKVYVDYAELGGEQGLRALRQLSVAYVVIKRYNSSDPETLPFLAALAREGRMVATVSPYRPDTPSGSAPEQDPFLHNTDARITAALERPGPALEIWQIDGPRQ